ncbi:YjjW family glycine radical enzyme activase [Photobacterium alginatilyticum]|uniref:YjjW family glycine radical enzyme activase n=1 Tax=Photobacterium alginatilyticum TaxID=1775171 RepID=A0ABW9YL59_9GAMM|nr:YjjW family glycine radical enzyme activase [Photobacterium alginatilyticum]NBI54592.1 YjjW family glycine radical enzyme activase [Photobacterium alginatilyticum]
MNSRLATATVSKILPFSCVDGPGNRLVIFLQGCNFNCKNCHNPHTIGLCDHCGDCIEHCPANALSMVAGAKDKNQIRWNADACTHCDTCLAVCPNQSSPKTQQYTVDDMLAVIRKNSLFITGITVTGGEATLQLNFIIELFQAIKSNSDLQHLSCMIDSNGSLSETGWKKVIPYIDGAMIDLKAWQEDTHRWITGRDNHRVFQSIHLLSHHNKLHELRLLVIPTITDFESEIAALADYLVMLPDENTRIRLNAFQHHGVTGEALSWPTCSKEEITAFAEQLTQLSVRNVVLPAIILES